MWQHTSSAMTAAALASTAMQQPQQQQQQRSATRNQTTTTEAATMLHSHSRRRGRSAAAPSKDYTMFHRCRRRYPSTLPHPVLLLLVCLLLGGGAQAASSDKERERKLEVFEGVPVDHQIGYIGDFDGIDSGPPYIIVAEAGVETDLAIDRTTGEIRTKVRLDRETRASYSLVAIPLSGLNVRVVVTVKDENDNAPTFPQPAMHIEFPENTPREVKRTLLPARDLDLEPYNTQRYNIVSGNVNDAFRLSSHRERDGVLYLDLQISGFLDRETTPGYSLLIEALDGGTPPLRGLMTVNITIQDVNDNQPIFNQSRYFATVPENATVGTSVLQVYASDTDAEENGLVEYAINRRQSDKEQMFRIDPQTGAIFINKALDFETKELHELVVVAKDHGEQPLETTAFVSIRVTDVNDNQPTINVIFLSDDASPKISESAQPGEFVARISVHDPDSKTEYSNVNVSLNGGDGHFALTTRDSSIYLVIVNLPLDRESTSNYTLSVVATDKGTPPLHAAKSIFLRITDVNDNPPEFEQELYHANVMEVADPGTSVLQVLAHDRDEGLNSALSYALAETPETHAQWFQIDAQTGLITTRSHIDCETEPVPQLTVIARDGGQPPLSSTATVLVTIHDVNDNEPIFDQSFYNVSVAENEPVGRCILKVSASDPDCGVNAMVNYTLGEGFKHLTEFEVRSASGEICIAGELDFERRSSYEFPVLATDRGGLSTTAMIKMQLTDVNDNRPVFYPREYNVSLKESPQVQAAPTVSIPVVAVVATDPDSGSFGQVSYRIVAGNEAGIFRIDRSSGEIFVSRPDSLSVRTQPMHMLNISATDGGGLRTSHDAIVFLSIIDALQRPPIFEKARYNYYVKENIPRGTVVGSVIATSGDTAHRSPVRYSIYSGDPDGYFSIEGSSGNIRIARPLDHEAKAQVLLNIQATLGEPPVYGHTQVNIEVEDVNDNAPEFEASLVRISVPENADLGTPLYAAHAHDKDSGSSGQVTYSLAREKQLFAIDPRSGHLVLSQHLDYETSQRHSLIVTATDGGVPPLATNLTILVDVQDVNDNPPMFEREEYAVNVSESRAVNSQIVQVNATDLDTGNNARITYRIVDAGADNAIVSPGASSSSSSSDVALHFGIFPNSGWIYLRAPLDRETRDRYQLVILATDNGTPAAHARTRVVVRVLDANDNDPRFQRPQYEFRIEENLRRGSVVGVVAAKDLDLGENAAIRYSLLPANSSFQVHPVTGEISTREPLDRELRELYDLVVEARDQGIPMRSARVPVRVHVSDVNDNAPEIADPQEDVVSVREEQPPGTEVVRIRAIDRDHGQNASITYSIVKGRDSDGHGLFSIDAATGVIRTRVVLDHEERSIYRLGVAATDGGQPPKETLRMLRVEVLDLNDNRPTFTSSSLVFRVREDANVGHVVGSITPSERLLLLDNNNSVEDSDSEDDLRVTYTLNPLTKDLIEGAFDIDRHTGNLVVARLLDREVQSEFRLEIRALDMTASNNPQSSAITVKIEVADVNDNAPHWPQDPIDLRVSESTPLGSIVHNFTASDADTGTNGELQYRLLRYYPLMNETQEQAMPVFALDSLTGALSLQAPLDFETVQEYMLIVQALDQSSNVTERLQTSVTVRLRVLDANDNAPEFVSPNTKGGSASIFLSDATRIGETVAHIVALDRDAGENGRLTYDIEGGNGEGRFRINGATGVIELVKSLPPASEDVDKNGRFTLLISAIDHGLPEPKKSTLSLQLLVQGSHNNPPRFLQAVYRATILENVPSGSFVLQVTAKSFHGGENANLSYEIPSGIAGDLFHVDWQRGIVTTRGAFDRETQASYILPIYVRDANRLASASSSAAAVRKQRSSESGAAESNSGQHFDVATVIITIGDVNDNAPEFRAGSCYGLAVPENSEAGVIHTVVASDADEGANADIIYSITGGNLGNKFSIDARSGELSCRPLDREQHSRYTLQVQASDRGQPNSRQGHCNITILVEDQNDNAPRFDLAKYVASVAEDAPIGASVVRIKATDADLGVNARLVYSLANETQWQFAIDSKSGLITTVGKLDRELQSSYSFMVLATDGGRYEVRSARVPVQINVLDVNDNHPVFERYPYIGQVPALIQPGQTLLKVQAHDADQGLNGELLYSLKGEAGKFRINPNTGALSATQSLASESGRLLQLEIIARDKGNPHQSSVGLIELLVGEPPQGTPVLRFQNETYRVKLRENSPTGTRLLQVVAVRSDGRRQKVQFSFGAGNDEGIFSLDPASGEIRVANPSLLDFDRFATPTLAALSRGRAMHYEEVTEDPSATEDDRNGTRSQRALASTSFALASTQPNELRLVIAARSSDGPILSSYAELIVELEDENDNSPQFSQRQFVATVSEGNSKGTFVAQVQAFDSDAGANARLRYHIVDGNHDNAFVIEPAFSGIVKTNIVLDREIRDVYNLKIIATDEGVPQMTGTSTIRVQIVDVNDNQPTFPPNNLVSVSEATELGAVIASISANDVDTYPTLTYRLVSDSSVDDESITLFALDRYSGKLVLKRRLDYELQQEYQLEVIASDAAHEARTTLTVRVNDENDNAPIFLAQQPPAYFAILPAVAEVADSLSMDLELLTVNATDADAEGSSSRIQYSIDPPIEGFSVGAASGVVSVNMSRLQLPESSSGDYFVRILARDGGKLPLSGATLLRVQASDSGTARSQFQQTQYRAQISEAAPLGSVVLQLSQDVQDHPFVIAAGNEEAAFELLQSKAIVLVKPLDRERNDLYKLRLLINRGAAGVGATATNSSAGITVVITVLDANDNFPIFDRSAKYEAEISELAPLRYSIAQLVALDADQENSPNSEVVYDITSGNDEHMFTIDLVSGVLFVNNRLDYDSGATSYELIIRACDSHHPRPLCSLQPFHLELHDENDNEPKFPLSEYVHFLAENEPLGSSVFQAHASDLDRGPFGALNYSLAATAGDDSSWKLFRVDSHSGMVSSAAVFDFEQRQRYDMELRASDMGGKGARVAVRVEIDSRDEFAPQFSERTYRFVLPAAAALPQGFVVGQVTATDADSGPDGRVVYQLSAPHTHFKVNRSSGAVLIKRKLKLDDDSLGAHDGRDISLVISASSGRQNSLTAMAVVEIALDPLAHPGTNLASAGINGGGGSMGDWAIGFLIAFLLILCAAAGIFLFVHMRSRKPRNVVKPHLSTETVGVGNSNSYVDPSAFDTIPIRGGISGGAAGGASGQFAPPKYDEIPPFGPHAGSSGAATTSELSGSEQSGSSGRGSAEDDGEDEEIRMINEGPLHHRGGAGAGGSDDGRISDISVQNTQEYLARLGIVDHDPSGSGGGGGASSMAGSSHPIPMPMTMPMVDSLHMFHDEDAATARSDITNLIYAKLNDVAGGNGGGSERGSSADDAATTAGSIGTIGTAITGHGHGAAMMGSYGEVPVPVPVVVGGSNVGGSLSSIVHSEEELTGSYNWDYLLDWGPQYQPLAHVFSEIARLKDDTMSEHSGHSGSGASSSAKSKHSSSHSSAGAGSVVLKPPPPPTHIPPPLLTNVAPRAINLPMRLPPHLSMAGGLPRSPIGHEASGSFSTSSAMSPSFSPSLSPLATRSPSISPLGNGPPTHLPHVSLPRHGHAPPPQPTQRGNVGTRM